MAVSVDIQGRVNLNTQDAQNQLHTLANQVNNFQPINQSAGIASQISDLENPLTTDSLISNREVNENLANIINLMQRENSDRQADRQLARHENAGRGNRISYDTVNAAIGNSAGTISQLLNRDYAGAGRNTFSQVGRLGQNLSNFLADTDANPIATGVMGGIGTLGIVIGALVGLLGIAGKKALNEYEKNLPSMEEVYKSYGKNIFSTNPEYNAFSALEMAHNMQPYSQGTGLTNAEFMQRASVYAKYGERDYYSAASATRAAANMSRITGVGIDELQHLQGLNYRYGGIDGTSTLNQVYRQASRNGITIDDLHKYFPELISNITTAMEEGINKGFTRSVEDVADSVSFITNLSEDEVWKKNAGKTYSSMASGMAGAVDLSSSNDLIMYQAINRLSTAQQKAALGGTSTGNAYLDKALILENGPTAPLAKAVHEQLQSVYGNDILAGVMSYKEMYGLNTKGAYTLYNALSSGKTDKEIERSIHDITTDSQYQSDTTVMNDTLNKINDNLQDAGKYIYDLKVDANGIGDKITNGINRIISFIGGPTYKNMVKPVSSFAFSKKEKDFSDMFEEDIGKGLENPDTSLVYQEIVSRLNKLSPEQLQTLNYTDSFQKIDWSNGEQALADLINLTGEDGNNLKGVKLQSSGITKNVEQAIDYIKDNKNINDTQESILINGILNNLSYSEATTTKSGSNELSNSYAEQVEKLKDLGENGTYTEMLSVLGEMNRILQQIQKEGIVTNGVIIEN